MTRSTRIALLTLPALLAAACSRAERQAAAEPDVPVTMESMRPALASFTADDLLLRTSALSADSMEGRLPGTLGEERAVRYIEGEFRALGLAPGNPDGTYTQVVPLVGLTPKVTASLTIGGRAVPLQGGTDYIAESARVQAEVKVENSDMVFVGYGIVAPEYGWDDYKDVDVTGKTIVMLVNDPAITLPGDTALDGSIFRGKAMTYYGRWTYKYEIAAAKGAKEDSVGSLTSCACRNARRHSWAKAEGRPCSAATGIAPSGPTTQPSSCAHCANATCASPRSRAERAKPWA